MTPQTLHRTPAVAGYFYPSEAQELRALVASLLPEGVRETRAIAVIVPHAGYRYSGKTAGMVYAQVVIPERVILVGPDHRGVGRSVCIFPGGEWETPLGGVQVDEEVARALLSEVSGATGEAWLHTDEHSLEVQLPFLQVRRPGVRGSFVMVGDVSLATAREIGKAIAKVAREVFSGVLLVASTDLSHYLPEWEANKRDQRAIEAMLAMDEGLLYERVEGENITMCGYKAAAVVLVAAKALGAKKATLVDYRTSGATSSDFSAVVGYAGIILQ